MPMIDVYAAAGTFSDTSRLAVDLSRAIMRWEKVPDIALFADNTAAFVHELPADAIRTAAGQGNAVRVQVLTPAGVLDREQKLGLTDEITKIVTAAAGDPSLSARTWVLVTEAPDGGWGIGGHAYTRAEIGEAARAALSAG